ncbi:MAG TPA: hypothetical protein VMF69_23800 [Gemmataceae bacterium]|nr:hypothetical protein [Gemmataceae bacterium]
MHATDYAYKLRDTLTERELAKQLRNLSEEERYAFILEMLDVHLLVALELANGCLRRRDLLTRLLEVGLSRVKDLSSITVWLERIVPRLGVRRVLEVLSSQLDLHPFAVGSALYFMQGYVKKENAVDVDAFHQLYEKAQQKGIRGPDLSGFFKHCSGSSPSKSH